jgi:polysaccharide export outer membrane protein
MSKFFNMLLLSLFLGVAYLFAQQLPPGISPSSIASMSPSERSALENQAKAQGVSQEEINAYKQKYGAAAKDTNGVNKSMDNTIQPSEAEANPAATDYNTQKEKSIKPATSDNALRYFGYDIFKSTPDAFKPTASGPIDPGYLVGPGDVLRLSVWGQVEFQYELPINLEGKIFIPVAGQVYVSGTPFEKLQDKIKALLSRHYSGLATTPPKTFIDLSVAKLRPIRIFIMGEVNNPGGYTVSSYATVFNALYSVGGPLESGSLRSITVSRNNKRIASVDMYDYLLTGKCTSDVRLQNNDMVFVPQRGKTTAISGSVFRPGYYELRENENLIALLSMCGSVLSTTNIDHALVKRVIPFADRESQQDRYRVIDVNLKKYLDGKEELLLFDRDVISITPLAHDLHNFVGIEGAVQYPGLYQSDTITLRSLIFDRGRPNTDSVYLKRADLIRLNGDLVTTSVIRIDLEKLLADPSMDHRLRPGDRVIVYSKSNIRPTLRTIIVEGEVNKPGIYHADSNMTVTDAILRAGGFTKEALKTKADIYRVDRRENDTLTKSFAVSLPDEFDYAPLNQSTMMLVDGDRIVVRPDPFYYPENIIKVQGLVRYQGVYSLERSRTRLSDILEKAGGPLPGAYLGGAVIMRKGLRVVANVEAAYERKQLKDNILLQKGDSIYIPPAPNNVWVHGQVNNPGLIGYSEGQSVRSYIDRAGGYSEKVECILFKKPNGETRKVGWLSNPVVPDGSEIFVTKKPDQPLNEQNKGPSISEVIRDTLAIITSAVTIIVLVTQVKK